MRRRRQKKRKRKGNATVLAVLFLLWAGSIGTDLLPGRAAWQEPSVSELLWNEQRQAVMVAMRTENQMVMEKTSKKQRG